MGNPIMVFVRLGWLFVVGVAALNKLHNDFLSTNVIPDDYQVSSFLYKGQPKIFFYLLQQDVKHLSVTLTPCTSAVEWAVRYRNASGKVSVSNGEQFLWERRGQEAKTFTMKGATLGLYTVQATSLDTDSYIELFVSTRFQGGHPALQLTRSARMAFTNRRAKGELTVRWEPSGVDPSLMSYWLVVSSVKPYWSLCEAQGSKYGVKPPEHRSQVARHLQTPPRLSPAPSLRTDTIIEYAGKRRSIVVKGLVGGRIYFFDLFAVMAGTNLTFLYGSAASKYYKGKPFSLRDSISASVNIRRLQGRATFRYKVKNNFAGGNPLEWYVMPCGGGSLDAEIRTKDRIIVPRQRVEGYSVLTVEEPAAGSRFLLKLNASDPEDLSRITSVEVMATRRGLPLPRMPAERRLREYGSLTGCESVTVGWLPILDPGTSPVRYCVKAKELHYPAWFSPLPDQCGLEASLNALDFQVLQCQEVPPNSTRSVITEQVKDLKPGRNYELQVTVKKPKTKMLSYQILSVHTKSSC